MAFWIFSEMDRTTFNLIYDLRTDVKTQRRSVKSKSKKRISVHQMTEGDPGTVTKIPRSEVGMETVGGTETEAETKNDLGTETSRNTGRSVGK